MQISIQNLKIYGIIGLLESERKVEQKILVNAKIKYNFDGNNFLNYADIAELIKSTIITSKFKLLEDALETITDKIKRVFPQITQIKLEILKPDILQDCTVGVKIKKIFKKN